MKKINLSFKINTPKWLWVIPGANGIQLNAAPTKISIFEVLPRSAFLTATEPRFNGETVPNTRDFQKIDELFSVRLNASANVNVGPATELERHTWLKDRAYVRQVRRLAVGDIKCFGPRSLLQ